MTFLAVSDIHIQSQHDEFYFYLLKCCEEALNRKVDHFILLGDIFDFFCGRHQVFFKQYHDFFSLIFQICQQGSTVHYFYGNHDFSFIEGLHEYFDKCGMHSLKSQVMVWDSPIALQFNGVSFLFMHGDELEQDLLYQRYKKFVRSRLAKNLMNEFFSGVQLLRIGQWASNHSQSRRRRRPIPFNETFVQEKYRKAVQIWASERNSWRYLIAGHSHVKDFYNLNGEGEDKKTYINLGHCGKEKHVLYYDGTNLDFVSIVVK